MRIIALFLLAAVMAYSQRISFGTKGGLPLTDTFEASWLGSRPSAVGRSTSYLSTTSRYTFGPMVEIPLPRGLAVEVDVRYKRLHYARVEFTHDIAPPTSTANFSKTVANRWEIPLLLKYRIGTGRARPHLVGGGPSTSSPVRNLNGNHSPYAWQAWVEIRCACVALEIRSNCREIPPSVLWLAAG